MVVMTPKIKEDIKYRASNGESLGQLSRVYGTSPSYVSNIKNGHVITKHPHDETPQEKVHRLVLRKLKYLGTRKLKRVKK